MLDRFAVQQLLRAGLTARAVARQAGISLRSVRRIAREAPITGLDAPTVAVGPRSADRGSRMTSKASSGNSWPRSRSCRSAKRGGGCARPERR